MNKLEDQALQEVKRCDCRLCLFQTQTYTSTLPSDIGTDNDMDSFIKMLPLGFPLILQQTVILHKRDESSTEFHSYFNVPHEQRKKYNIIHQTLKNLNTMNCQNVQIYYPHHQRIITKYEAQSLLSGSKGQDIRYIQPYQHNPIIRVEYSTQLQDKLDNILREYLDKQIERIRGDTYKFNEEFLEWVHREYGEEIFFYFITELSSRVFKAITQGQIKYAVFFWVAERSAKDMLTVQKKGGQREKYNAMQQLGRPQRLNFKPKLINVRNFKVQKIQKLFSFQEQYQSLIKKRIANSTKKTISAIKNKAYRGRLESFRNKIQDAFKNEQKKIMDGIQEEKQFEYQVDSQKMARLLIPTLGPNQNLRQVLNDQNVFREVFLSKKTQHHQRNFTTLPNLSKTEMGHRKSLKKNPQNIELTQTRVKRRYQKLLTTPSTHE